MIYFSVYLRTDPEVAFQRIKTRNRFEEKDVTLEYIQHLHELHDKWLNVHTTDVPESVPVSKSIALNKYNTNGLNIINIYNTRKKITFFVFYFSSI